MMVLLPFPLLGDVVASGIDVVAYEPHGSDSPYLAFQQDYEDEIPSASGKRRVNSEV